MPPAKSWTPSSSPPDAGEGTRDAPHGYRPWPNSGRDEPASAFRIRRPTLLESLLEKIWNKRVVVGEAADADVILVRKKTAQAVAQQLQRGQLIILELPTAKSRREFVARLRKTKKAFLLAWRTPQGVEGLDDDSRRAAEALYAGRA